MNMTPICRNKQKRYIFVLSIYYSYRQVLAMYMYVNCFSLTCECIFFLQKIMKSHADASPHLDGKRHQNGMKIDNSAVKVISNIFIAKTKIHYCPHNTILDCITEIGECLHTSSFGWKHYLRSRDSKGCCTAQLECVPQCTELECGFLCRHTNSCTCWDYREGHLCKHCQKIRAITFMSSGRRHVMQQHLIPPLFTSNTQPSSRENEGKEIHCVPNTRYSRLHYYIIM